MIGAGDLNNRFTLQRDVAEPDWTGHPGDPDWQDQFTVWGKITFMRGGETVIAARLTAKQPAILTIRISAQALTILPSDRIVDARTGEMFNIREQPRRSRDDPGLSADAGQTERDAGRLAGLTGAEKDRIKELEREVRELRQANEILKKASAYFAAAELDRLFRK